MRLAILPKETMVAARAMPRPEDGETGPRPEGAESRHLLGGGETWPRPEDGETWPCSLLDCPDG
jgi:hypothetical protein